MGGTVDKQYKKRAQPTLKLSYACSEHRSPSPYLLRTIEKAMEKQTNRKTLDNTKDKKKDVWDKL
jgi:hypothetical protein